MAGSAEVGEQEDAHSVKFAFQDERAVVGLGEMIGGGGTQDLPATNGVAAIHGDKQAGGLFQGVNDAAISGGTKTDVAGENMFDGKRIADLQRATDIAKVAMGERERRDMVDTPSVKERNHDGIDQIGVAAINEQILARIAGLNKNGAAAIQRKDGERGRGAGEIPTPAVKGDQADGGGERPLANAFLERKAGQHGDERNIIDNEVWHRRPGDVEVGAGNFDDGFTEMDDERHPEPGAVVKEHRDKREPAAADEAAEVAREGEAAERNDNEVGDQRDGAEDVKVVGDQRPGTEERGNGSRQ